MADGLESLKKELLQAQKTRDEMMKWKFALVAGIASVALGFSKATAIPHAELALCVIPLACAYVDLLCRNLSVRTKLISDFIATRVQAGDLTADFERHYQKFDVKRGQEALEGVALIRSTQALSIGIVPVGLLVALQGGPSVREIAAKALSFVLAGAAGWCLTELVERRYKKQLQAMKGLDPL